MQVAASAPLTSTQPVQAKVSVSSVPAVPTPTTTQPKKAKKDASPFLVPGESNRFFEGGSSSWGTDEHSAALNEAAKHEFSALADKLLTEMETKVSETHITTTAEAAAEITRPKEADDAKRRKKGAEESSEEDVIVLASPHAETSATPTAAKPKAKPKPVEGDLSIAAASSKKKAK